MVRITFVVLFVFLFRLNHVLLNLKTYNLCDNGQLYSMLIFFIFTAVEIIKITCTQMAKCALIKHFYTYQTFLDKNGTLIITLYYHLKHLLHHSLPTVQQQQSYSLNIHEHMKKNLLVGELRCEDNHSIVRTSKTDLEALTQCKKLVPKQLPLNTSSCIQTLDACTL